LARRSRVASTIKTTTGSRVERRPHLRRPARQTALANVATTHPWVRCEVIGLPRDPVGARYRPHRRCYMLLVAIFGMAFGAIVER
jgi:hypothetical protein